jgi:universal stress protein E
MSESGIILSVIEPENHPLEVVKRAAWLAGMNNCNLHLLLCDPEVGPLGEGFFLSNEAQAIRVKIDAAQKDVLDEIMAVARAQGATVTGEVVNERPIAEAVLNRALDMNPLYLVKGTHYHSVAERSIFVDSDWHLMRNCPYPLWLVKPQEMKENPVIVAAVDPTHSHDKPAVLDQLIVNRARQIADKTDGEVHLLHTYQRLINVGAAASRTFKPIELPIDELDKQTKEDHRKKLDELANANNIDEKHIHQLPGSTRDIVPMFVRANNVDLVVMGALARWSLKRAIIGSTAERVMDHLPCDILIVKSAA